MPRQLAPIAVYVYNRHEHFKKCIRALQSNSLASQSELYVVSDAAKVPEHQAAIDEVRSYASGISGFKKVHLMFRSHNLGAFKSISSAELKIIQEHGRIISMEDDIVTSPDFLKFINDGLDFYENDKSVFSIAGYCHPVTVKKQTVESAWFYYWHLPWGYGTWKDRYLEMDITKNRWQEIKNDKKLYQRFKKCGQCIIDIAEADMEARIEAIDVRICIEMFIRGMYTAVPYKSKVKNIGFDGSGMHCGLTQRYNVDICLTNSEEEFIFPKAVHVDSEISADVNEFIIASNYSTIRRFLKWLGIYNVTRKIYRSIKLTAITVSRYKTQ